jgi:hypothetical protein
MLMAGFAACSLPDERVTRVPGEDKHRVLEGGSSPHHPSAR